MKEGWMICEECGEDTLPKPKNSENGVACQNPECRSIFSVVEGKLINDKVSFKEDFSGVETHGA